MSRRTDAYSEKLLALKLARVLHCLKETGSALSSMKENHDDTLLLEQLLKQLDDVKQELSVLYEKLIALDLADHHPLVTQHVKLEKLSI